MALSYLADGSVGSGSSSVATTMPAGIATGDLLILVVTGKYAYPDSTPSGWTLLAQTSAGNGSNGVDSGTAYISVYYATYDGSMSAPTVTITGGNSNIGKIYAWTGKTGTWGLDYTTGSDTSPGTSWSATGAATLSLTSGDRIFVASAVNANDAGVRASSHAISATGATFGTVSEKYDNGINTGDDSSAYAVETSVDSGTATGAPTYTNTSAGSGTNFPAGPTVFVRIYDVVSGDATFTTTVGTATAAGGTTSFTGDGLFTTTVGTATAAGGTTAFTGGATFSTVAGVATAAGGSSSFTGTATFTTTVGTATAAGGSSSFTGGATFTTVVGVATASGGDSTFTGASGATTFSTTVGTATAAGGTSTFTGGAVFTTAAGSATASGGVSSFTGTATFTTTVGTATASGGLSSFIGGSSDVTFTTLVGEVVASGGRGRMIGAPHPRTYRNLSPRTKVPPLSIFHSTS